MDADAEKVLEVSPTQPENSDGSNSNSSSLVSRLRKLLFRKMLVGIKDGRFFLGVFHCIDKQERHVMWIAPLKNSWHC
ncbi:uncharacterized protein LOC126683327 isoform X3 [Mercurialis annua]|uniref:uncharacterized protein LOC126683327 isoform X3 n=1 Tax=Mercurialis annua TaxID=3986 RepID=UPI00216091AC|nr:uncharacterized protein LOC126683327 isoform X3 [Mercurialis annua]